MQCSLTHFVLLGDAKKIGIDVNTEVTSYGPYILGEELTMVLSLSFSFFYAPLSLVFLAISVYFAIFLLIDLLLSKKTLIYVLLGILLLACFFVFAILYATIKAPLGLLIIIVFPLVISLVSFVNNYLIKRGNNN